MPDEGTATALGGEDTTATTTDTPPPPGDPTAPEGGAPPPPPETPIGDYLDENGAFVGDWQNLIPEDFRGREVYGKFTDLAGLLKEVGHLDLVVGRQGKGVYPPGEDATPTERDLFYKAIGRPDTPDGYDIEVPDDLKDYYDDEALKKFRKAFHEAGLTPAQVKIVMGADTDEVRDGVAQMQERADAQRAEAEKALRAQWGEAYDGRMALAQRMVAENCPKDKQEAILNVIGNEPHVIDFLATIGKKFTEGGIIQGEPPRGVTPAEAKNRADEISDELAAHPDMPPAKRERLVAERRRLFEMVPDETPNE